MPTPLTDVERVLVVTAHPDDVDFGAGGTVRKWTEAGSPLTGQDPLRALQFLGRDSQLLRHPEEPRSHCLLSKMLRRSMKDKPNAIQHPSLERSDSLISLKRRMAGTKPCGFRATAVWVGKVSTKKAAHSTG